MDPRLAAKGEYNYGERDGTARSNEPGVYYHPEAKTFVETANTVNPNTGHVSYFAETGRIQADAFVQLGYRPATEAEIATYRKQSNAKEAETVVKTPATAPSK